MGQWQTEWSNVPIIVSLEVFPHQRFFRPPSTVFSGTPTPQPPSWRSRLWAPVGCDHKKIWHWIPRSHKKGGVPPNYPKKKCQLAHQPFWHQTAMEILWFSLLAPPFFASSAKSLAMSFRSSWGHFNPCWSAKFEVAGRWRCTPMKMDMFPKKGTILKENFIFQPLMRCLGAMLVFGGV